MRKQARTVMRLEAEPGLRSDSGPRALPLPPPHLLGRSSPHHGRPSSECLRAATTDSALTALEAHRHLPPRPLETLPRPREWQSPADKRWGQTLAPVQPSGQVQPEPLREGLSPILTVPLAPGLLSGPLTASDFRFQTPLVHPISPWGGCHQAHCTAP